MTSFWRHVPTRFLINQCQIHTFLILKSDIIENSRIELRGIVPSNQIKVIFIIILPFNLVHLWYFPVSHRNWRKRRNDYWGAKGYVAPPSQIIGGGGLPPPPPPRAPFFLRLCVQNEILNVIYAYVYRMRYWMLSKAIDRNWYFRNSNLSNTIGNFNLVCTIVKIRKGLYLSRLFTCIMFKYIHLERITQPLLGFYFYFKSCCHCTTTKIGPYTTVTYHK